MKRNLKLKALFCTLLVGGSMSANAAWNLGSVGDDGNPLTSGNAGAKASGSTMRQSNTLSSNGRSKITKSTYLNTVKKLKGISTNSQLGSGYYSFSLKNANVSCFKLAESATIETSPNSDKKLHQVHDSKSASEAFGVEVNASVSYGLFSLSAENSYASSSQDSSNDMMLNFRNRAATSYEIKNKDDINLTPIGQEYLNAIIKSKGSVDSINHFFAACGTDVITQQSLGREANLDIKISATSSEAKKETINSLSAGVGSFGSVDSAISNSNATVKNNIKISASVHQSGGDSAAITAKIPIASCNFVDGKFTAGCQTASNLFDGEYADMFSKQTGNDVMVGLPKSTPVEDILLHYLKDTSITSKITKQRITNNNNLNSVASSYFKAKELFDHSNAIANLFKDKNISKNDPTDIINKNLNDVSKVTEQTAELEGILADCSSGTCSMVDRERASVIMNNIDAETDKNPILTSFLVDTIGENIRGVKGVYFNCNQYFYLKLPPNIAYLSLDGQSYNVSKLTKVLVPFGNSTKAGEATQYYKLDVPQICRPSSNQIIRVGGYLVTESANLGSGDLSKIADEVIPFIITSQNDGNPDGHKAIISVTSYTNVDSMFHSSYDATSSLDGNNYSVKLWGYGYDTVPKDNNAGVYLDFTKN